MTRKPARPPRAKPGVGGAAPIDARSSVGVLALPVVASVALGALAFLPMVPRGSRLYGTLVGTSLFLIVAAALLLVYAASRRRALTIDVQLKKQHYLQACAQAAVFAYWGYYWREVYASAHLILAQLLFAYAIDMLLSWWRRGTYTLGFGPFPIIFSINLFLWFKPDWFVLQFAMVAAGFLAREFLRWNRDGRSAHIFNPSSLPLSLFSIGLILTGSTDSTWGQQIATTLFYPPQIFLFIFLIGLPGQFLFGVTTMTMSAVVTMYAIGLAYVGVTGTFLFFDDYIPIAVFLGMHLLFTDPSTSPRTELGRVAFGALYASSVTALYVVLGAFGVPTFYDKLLPVPLLNLSIRAIDRAAASRSVRWLDPGRLAPMLTGRRRHLAYMAVWAAIFTGMSLAWGVGDTHRGRWVPFWQQACGDGRLNACANLTQMEARYCAAGSGWACNELGAETASAKPESSREALDLFGRACAAGYAPGCENQTAVGSGSPARRAAPTLADYPVLLSEGKGRLVQLGAAETYARACRQGWTDACSHSDGR